VEVTLPREVGDSGSRTLQKLVSVSIVWCSRYNGTSKALSILQSLDPEKQVDGPVAGVAVVI